MPQCISVAENSYRYSVYIISQVQGLSCLELADELSHVAHRTEKTPGSRTVEDGEYMPRNGRARFAPCILPLPSTYRLVYPIVLPAVLPHPLRRVGIL